MNLHGIVAPVIGAVNPLIPVEVRISTGYATAADGRQQPAYATPGGLVGSLAAALLTVASVSAGVLQPGQTVAGAGVLPGTVIVSQSSGPEGGAGTYVVNKSQTVSSEAMTTALLMRGQVQPMTFRDLAQVDGLNLNGTRRKVYLFGSTDGIVRVKKKGGDLVLISTGGVNDGVFLVAQVLEQFPDWVSAAVTLQDEGVS